MKTQFIYAVLVLFVLFSCSKDDSASTNDSANGTGGSTARFVLVDDFLYVIDDQKLSTYNVSVAETPSHINTQEIGFGIETIFPFEEYLLIGSTSSMFIYEIGVNGVPTFISNYEHVETCDPVVAQGDFAYVTLSSTRVCGGNFSENNRLEIYDIQNVQYPNLINVFSLNAPTGLAVDGDYLFVCTANEGLVVLNVNDPYNVFTINTIEGFTARDVIAKNNLLLVVCPDGLRQFDYTDIQNINELSYLQIAL